jgi:uncharacterized protein (DUF1697 family)
MTAMTALLRGVNVGGRNRLPMAELRTLVETLGFGSVQTYVQSGNLVFTGSGSPTKVAASLEAGISDTFGLEVPVIVRTARQLARILGANPFAGPGVDPRTLHVTFLDGSPTPERAAGLAETASDAHQVASFGDDRFEAAGTDIFLHCPGGYGTTKLNNTFFEHRTGRVATTRNWRTVTTLAAMAGLGVTGPGAG